MERAKHRINRRDAMRHSVVVGVLGLEREFLEEMMQRRQDWDWLRKNSAIGSNAPEILISVRDEA
jgi:hypothetical protein